MTARRRPTGLLRPNQSARAREVRLIALALARWGGYEDVGLELDMAVDRLVDLTAEESRDAR